MRLVVLITWLALALLGCDSESGASDGGGSGASGGGAGASGAGSCNVEAPSECPSDMPTYSDVEPIFAERCTGCHAGPDGDMCPTCWSLESYTDIKHWTQEIRSVMLQCAMPPRESGMTMPDAERMTLLEWIRCGAPE